MTAAMPSWVLDALDDNTRRKLILSWRRVPGRGVVVIAASMEEVELETEHEAVLFLAGISSALTAFHDGEAKLAAIGTYCREHKGDAGFSWLHAQDILAIISSEEGRNA